MIRLGQKGFLDIIEKSITLGATVLVENINESVDPVLDALLGRNLIKKGKYVTTTHRQARGGVEFFRTGLRLRRAL